jgi:enoyl-CoA hydratase
MSQYETLHYEESGGVATITLDRPGGNRINIRMLKELSALCDHLEDRSQARVVVLRGAGGAFSGGVDFEDFHPDRPVDIHGFNKWEKLCTRLERLPVATVALVDGEAAGGGLQLALVCDLRVATPSATFQLPEVHLGFLPGMATFRLAKYMGLGRARRMMLTAEVLTAAQAEENGLIDKVEPDLEAGLGWAQQALGPNHSVAIELTRRLLNESFSTDYENAIGHFLAAQHRAVSQTAFLETLKKHQK